MNKMRETNSVRAKIHGREYVLRTNGDTEHLKALCAVLDARMQNVVETTGVIDTFKIAILAALSLAEDARRVKEEMTKLDEAIGKRSDACVSMLDRSLS
jgi:cell division protein ZapA (FtsZ GTPase activity inhibitor)